VVRERREVHLDHTVRGTPAVRAGAALPRSEEPRDPRPSLAVVRVADLQLHVPPGRAEPVLGHGHAGPLPDHVPPESDPRAPLELEPERRGLGQGAVERADERDRFQDEET
jgi:hypothetical protein